MSKLRDAVSKTHLQRLVQDVEPSGRPLSRGQRRRARVGAVSPLGSHVAANENGALKAPTGEPGPIREARARLRSMIAQATQDAPRSSIGIVLAIVNQETGNHTAANALIDEYGLERLFGIKKFSINS